MSDGTTVNPGTGGDKFDTEDLGANGKLQRVKLATGARGVDGGDVGPTNPMPVSPTVSLGTPPGAISATGPTTLYTPATGKKIRLKWLHLASSQDNSAEVVATVKIGSDVIYVLPLGNPGAFAHSSIREASNANDLLTLTLSASGRAVYPNFDVEEF